MAGRGLSPAPLARRGDRRAGAARVSAADPGGVAANGGFVEHPDLIQVLRELASSH
ncbi:MAG: hypothetical protein HYZ20_16355 [Burkholderiales bacterium]|nr:hypothetical protein [Burkholderiales bacterium]